MKKYEEEKSVIKDMVQSIVRNMGYEDYKVSNTDVKMYKKFERGILSFDEFKETIDKKNNLLKQYKKGLVDEKEYENIYEALSTPGNYISKLKEKHEETELDLDNCSSEELDRLLFLKLESEYNELTNNLLNKTPEEILDSHYELTSKREIIDYISNSEIYDEEKKKMLNTKNLLNEFYYDWLDEDIPLSDSMDNSIEETIATLTRFHNKEKNNNDWKK